MDLTKQYYFLFLIGDTHILSKGMEKIYRAQINQKKEKLVQVR